MMGKYLMQKVQFEMSSSLSHAFSKNLRISDKGLGFISISDGLITLGFYAFQPLSLAKRFLTNSIYLSFLKRLRVGNIHINFGLVENLDGKSFANPLGVPANFLSHTFLFSWISILDFQVVKWFSVCESKLIDHFFCQSNIQRFKRPMIGRCHNL